MKTYIKLIVALLITALGITSCVQPTGTPAQKARQTEANAQMANGVGMALLGVGAAALGTAQLNNSYNNRRYYYDGCYYYNRGYRHGRYYYY